MQSLRVRFLVLDGAVERSQRPLALRHRSLDDGGGFVGDPRAFGVGVSRLSRLRLQRLLQLPRARHHARDGGGVLRLGALASPRVFPIGFAQSSSRDAKRVGESLRLDRGLVAARRERVADRRATRLALQLHAPRLGFAESLEFHLGVDEFASHDWKFSSVGGVGEHLASRVGANSVVHAEARDVRAEFFLRALRDGERAEFLRLGFSRRLDEAKFSRVRGFERVAVSRDASFQRAEDARGGDGAVVGVGGGGGVLDVAAQGVFDLGAGEDVRELRLHGDAGAMFALEAGVEVVVGALEMRRGRLRGLGAARHLRQLELPLGHRLGVVLSGHVPRSARAVHVIHGSRAGVERARGIELPRDGIGAERQFDDVRRGGRARDGIRAGIQAAPRARGVVRVDARRTARRRRSRHRAGGCVGFVELPQRNAPRLEGKTARDDNRLGKRDDRLTAKLIVKSEIRP